MNGWTVFVVDDDAPVSRSVAKLVSVLGYKACAFEGAESFLAAYDGGPGCLLVDVRMPGMGGLELIEELARRGATMPAIIMSGHAEGDTAHRAGTPIIGVLEKPFSVDALRQLLARSSALEIRR